jgi:hypothetical protein
MAIAQTNWINHLMDLLQICSGVEDITKEILWEEQKKSVM